jgi:hypothetical protein
LLIVSIARPRCANTYSLCSLPTLSITDVANEALSSGRKPPSLRNQVATSHCRGWPFPDAVAKKFFCRTSSRSEQYLRLRLPFFDSDSSLADHADDGPR